MPLLAQDEDMLSRLESILFVAGGPVSLDHVGAVLDVSRRQVRDLLALLAQARAGGGLRVQLADDHAQLVTAPENVEVVHRFLGTVKPPALSRQALEALTVIAYHQPVTRSEIAALRGVNSDRAVQTLLARGLIEETGHRATLGSPTEYGTTFAFLEYFGLSSVADLPPLEEQDLGSEASALALGMRRNRR